MSKIQIFGCGFLDGAFWAGVFTGIIEAIRYRSRFKRLSKLKSYLALFISCTIISVTMGAYLQFVGSYYFLDLMMNNYIFFENLSASGDLYAKFWLYVYNGVGFDPRSNIWSTLLLSASILSWYVLAIAMFESALKSRAAFRAGQTSSST